MKLRKGTLLFLLLTCLAYTTLAQEVGYELKNTDVDIDDNGKITNYKSSNTNIIIPEKIGDITITGIGDEAFKEENLVAVVFAADSEVTTIGERAFRYNPIVTLTLPTILKTIGREAFQRNEDTGDNKITELILPATLETIGNWAFQYNKIAKLTIPGDSQLETIKSNAFEYSKIVGKLTLPATLKTIGESAFRFNSITELSLPPTLTTIGKSAFRNNSLTSVAFKVDLNKSQIKSIGSNAFSGNTGTGTDTGLEGITLPQHAGGDGITYKDSEDKTYTPEGSFTNFERSLVAVIPAHTLTAEDGEDGVTVVAGIITECTCNFLSNSIEIPEKIGDVTITGIGFNAFKEKSLVTVAFAKESQVVSIGNNAFFGNSIATLTLPTTLTTIGNGAFDKNQIITLDLPTIVTTIGWGAFRNNQIGTLTLPTTVTTIGNWAFQNNKLTKVTFEGNENDKSMIRSIGVNAFEGNTNLIPITLPSNGNPNFSHYVDTQEKEYAEGATITDFTLGYNAFIPYTLTAEDIDVDSDGIITKCRCDNLDSRDITIPASITKEDGNVVDIVGIGTLVFYAKKLTSVIILDGLTSIGFRAFASNRLTSLALPKSLHYIGNQAFYDNNLTGVTFAGDDTNKANITSIGHGAFADNAVTSINLPSNNTLATDDDFRYKDSAGTEYAQGVEFKDFDRSLYADIPYTLTADDIMVDDANGMITKCNCDNFDSRTITIPTTITKLDSDVTITITGIGDDVFANKYLATLSFSDNSEITTIGNRAFQYNSITTLTLPPSLTTIGELAFQYNSITTLTLPTTLTTIGTRAFQYNSITELTLPTTLTTIGELAFLDNPLPSFILPSVEIEGYRTYWQDGNSENLMADLTILKADFTKSFERISIEQFTLTLTIDETGASSEVSGLSAGENKIDKGVDFELKAMPAFGQRFVSWTIGKQTIQDNPYTLPASDTDISVTVAFELIPQDLQVTLTIAKEGEGTISPDEGTSTFEKGTTATLTATPQDGWRFDKWVIGTEERTDNPTSINLDGNKSATAHFVQLVTLTVEVNNEAGGSIEPSDDHFVVDKTATPSTQVLTAKPADGWRFDKWVISDEQDKTDNPTTITLDKNKTATAYFVEIVTLTLTIQGVGQVQGLEVGENPIDKGQEFTITATPNEGHEFEKWVFEGSNISTSTYTIPADKTQDKLSIEVHFEKKPFNDPVELTISTDGQGTVTPNTGINTYERGSGVDLTATPQDGWKFDKWVITSGEDGNGNPITETVDDVDHVVTVDADKTATAHFVEAVILTLTIKETEDSGEVSGLNAGENKIDKGADFELKATPASGQRFVSWTIGVETIVTEEYTLPATDTEADISITVTFEAIPQQVTLTLAIEGEGSINPSVEPNSVDPDNEMKGMYDIDTEVTLEATPNDGWRFDKWVIGTDESTDNPTDGISMDTDKTATAHFVKEEEEEAITSILTEVVSANPYPNPVTSQITLKAKDGDLIQLFSPKGKQQYSTQHTGNEVHTIDVSTLPVGVYLVRITDAEGNTTTKRILKK